MEQKDIGKLISKFRKAKGLTQKELAKRLNIGEKTISKWECGISSPDISILNELSNILGIETSDLLNENKVNIESKNKITSKKKSINSIPRKSKKSNKKIVMLIGILILILSILTTFHITRMYTEQKYNEIKITTNDKNFSMLARIFTSPEGKTIILKNILYQGSAAGTSKEPLVKNLTIFITSNEETIFVYNVLNDEEVENEELEPITSVLKRIPPIITEINKDTKIDKDNTKLKIEYINQEDEREVITIDLKVF